MTRSHAREIAVHMIFALSFGDFDAEELLEQQMNHERFEELAPDMPLYSQYPNEKQVKYIYALVRGVFGHGYELDDYIARYAKNWNFARIPRMAAAIMRTAMYEVLYMPEIPNAVAVNEAVEITKNYEAPEVVSFVNGVLGTFVRTEFPETPAKPVKTDEAEG